MLDKTSLTSTATKTLGNRAKWLKTYIEEAEFFERFSIAMSRNFQLAVTWWKLVPVLDFCR